MGWDRHWLVREAIYLGYAWSGRRKELSVKPGFFHGYSDELDMLNDALNLHQCDLEIVASVKKRAQRAFQKQ